MRNQTGMERNNRIVFDEIVTSYEAMRPDYPDNLFQDILEFADSEKGKNAIEIGAGTGKATTPFLHAGYNVTAIELGANMANFISNKFKEHSALNVIEASFENAVLEENHFDLIYAATAFHWVDPEIGCPKAYRLLTNGGTIALFRYNAVAAVGEKVYDEIQNIYERHYYSYHTLSTRPVKKSKQDFLEPSEICNSFGFGNLNDYGFKDITMKFYDGAKTFTADEYLIWLDTMSDHRSMPETNRKALYEDIRETIIRNGNYHKVDFIYQLYMGRK
jgi:ubiquinone/menaquinone biosynthesis C-methylase UbiE